jgi:hypothetical protein
MHRKGAYRFLIGRPEGKRSLKNGSKEVAWGTDWIDLAQNRNSWWALVNAVMNLQVS